MVAAATPRTGAAAARFFASEALPAHQEQQQQQQQQSSSSGWREPSYMVSTEPTVDPRAVKVPVLSDATRAQIFSKFKSDPAEWTVAKLAQSYNCSIDRIKAVIFLMQKRETMQKDAGVLQVPQVWKAVYDKHLLDPAANTVDALSAEFSLPAPEIEAILLKLRLHHRRKKNMDDAEADKESVLSRYAERGVDVRFRETATAPRKQSLTDNYFPELFDDDGMASAKEVLLKRVATETKAMPVGGLERFLAKNGDAMEKPLAVAAASTAAVAAPSRWKFALRDLAEPKAKTRIRTRTGGLRYATPLEEARRSWVKNPTGLDFGFYQSQLQQFHDPDADDQLAVQLTVNRRVKHQNLSEQSVAAAK